MCVLARIARLDKSQPKMRVSASLPPLQMQLWKCAEQTNTPKHAQRQT